MKLKCKICKIFLGEGHRIDLGALPFYYGKKDMKFDNLISDENLNAVIEQCSSCGIIQQCQDSVLHNKINFLYKLESSSQSTPMSKSEMGIKRARSFFSNTKFIFQPKSVLEIGCQDGYLLYELYSRGIETVCGIEPSQQVIYGDNTFKPKIIHDYFDKKLFSKNEFDTVISLWVFEHIYDLLGFLDSIQTILKKHGQLIISVPNAENQIISGDPGMFIYEHLFYFTRQSLSYVLQLAKFEIVAINTTKSDIYITAKKANSINGNSLIKEKGLQLITDYSIALDKVIEHFYNHTSNGDIVGFWGACPTSINLIKMVDLKDYVIFDSDESKIGSIISGLDVKVKEPTKENFKNLVDIVCISPLGAQEAISKQLNEFNFPYFNLFN